MHEILKLLHYAEAQDVKFFRIGTSGGLGTGLANDNVYIQSKKMKA